jgi:hypothetical protein
MTRPRRALDVLTIAVYAGGWAMGYVKWQYFSLMVCNSIWNDFKQLVAVESAASGDA